MNPSVDVDAIRGLMCREFAHMVTAGANQVRVRITHPHGAPTAAWFYSHRDHAWQREPATVEGELQVRAMQEELELVLSRGRGDLWQAREHGAADHTDYDISLNVGSLAELNDQRLPGYLAGLLFLDANDADHNRRQAVRHGRIG
ncbi:MAG: hypothetical protein ACK6D3_23690 [Planctomycetaceae bacterium]